MAQPCTRVRCYRRVEESPEPRQHQSRHQNQKVAGASTVRRVDEREGPVGGGRANRFADDARRVGEEEAAGMDGTWKCTRTARQGLGEEVLRRDSLFGARVVGGDLASLGRVTHAYPYGQWKGATPIYDRPQRLPPAAVQDPTRH